MTSAHRIVAMLLLFTAALLQGTIVQQVEIANVSPDLVVLVIVSIALLSGSIAGAAFGFCGGLMVGLLGALTLGPHAMLGSLIGYGAGRWGEQLITDEHPVPPLVAGIVGSFVMYLGRPLVSFLLDPAVTATNGIFTDALVGTMINALLAVPVFLFVRHVMLRVPARAHEDAAVDA